MNVKTVACQAWIEGTVGGRGFDFEDNSVVNEVIWNISKQVDEGSREEQTLLHLVDVAFIHDHISLMYSQVKQIQ
jgi:hypothetical protein